MNLVYYAILFIVIVISFLMFFGKKYYNKESFDSQSANIDIIIDYNDLEYDYSLPPNNEYTFEANNFYIYSLGGEYFKIRKEDLTTKLQNYNDYNIDFNNINNIKFEKGGGDRLGIAKTSEIKDIVYIINPNTSDNHPTMKSVTKLSSSEIQSNDDNLVNDFLNTLLSLICDVSDDQCEYHTSAPLP